MFKEIKLNQSRQVGDGAKSASLFNIVGATGSGGGGSSSAGGSSSVGGSSSIGSSSGGSVSPCRGPGPISAALRGNQQGICPVGMSIHSSMQTTRCGGCTWW